jgi:hypothetical protein
MEKYYLPISINKRRIHICHFTQQDYKEDFHFFEFIVHNKGNGDELFNINPNAFFINDQGCINDIKIDKTGIVGNIDNESIELTFTKGEYTQNGTITEEEGLYIRKEQSGRILVAINENYDENKIKIKLTLNISDNEKYHYSCIFHIVNSNDTLVEAGIDFGSESSQMAYRNVSKNEKIFPVVNIIENLKTFYHHHKDVDEYCHYYQYEKPEDSIPLFKSFFTVFTGKCDDLRIFLKPNSKEDATFINALLTKDITKFEDKELKLLPNLKYLQIQSGSFYDNTKVNHIDAKKQHNNGKEEWLTPDGINVSSENQMLSNYNNYYKRYILNYFLHVLFKVISENFSNPYIKLKLLVPNVYNQKRIYEIIHNIYKDCNSIINEYNEYRIKGIEVETISESDAAFLGFLYNKEKEIDHNNKIKLDSNKLFLLIDGGKGTLDFTILKSDDSSNRFNSIYRGGIPGSGQIINYAIMQIFNDGLKPYDIDIEEFIKTFNSSEKNEFLNAIEKIKQNCKFPSTGNNLIQNVDKNHIDEIQNQLKNIKNANNKESIFKLLDIFSENNQEIPDLNNRLNSAINALSIAISEKVEDFKSLHKHPDENSDEKLFYQIILSGRAFKFKAFETKIRDLLKDFSNDIIYPESKAKTACIEGVMDSAKYKINLNSLMIGFPNILIEKSSENGLKRQIVNNEVLKKVNFSNQNDGEGFSLFRWIKSLLDKNEERKNISNVKLETRIDEDLVSYGLNITPNDYRNLFLSLPGEEFNLAFDSSNKIVNLFFTEKEFILRTNDSSLDIGEADIVRHSERLMNFSNYPIINTDVNLSNDLNNKPLNSTSDIIVDDRIDIGGTESSQPDNSKNPVNKQSEINITSEKTKKTKDIKVNDEGKPDEEAIF